MSDLAVERWRQRGRIYLWRCHQETRNFPGMNLVSDLEGATSAIELLDLMSAAVWSSSRSIQIAVPTELVIAFPGHSHPNPWTAGRTLSIAFPKGKAETDLWRWTGSIEEPKLTIGQTKLDELRHAFELLVRNEGNFCVNASTTRLHDFRFDDMAIWFWYLAS
jgi:hypothetical protein